jgi:hypothetical protein
MEKMGKTRRKEDKESQENVNYQKAQDPSDTVKVENVTIKKLKTGLNTEPPGAKALGSGLVLVFLFPFCNKNFLLAPPKKNKKTLKTESESIEAQ